MPVFNFNNMAKRGMVKDMLPTTLPQESEDFAWSDALNMRFVDGSASQIKGEVVDFTTSASVKFLQCIHSAMWLAVSNTTDQARLYRVNNSVGYAVREVLLTGSAMAPLGNGPGHYAAMMGPFVVMAANNRKNYANVPGRSPEYFKAQFTSVITVLPLPYDATTTWAAGSAFTAGIFCFFMRSLGRFLVAFNIREGNDANKPHMVWWSDAADTDAIPSTWDPGDTTNLAGRTEIPTGGAYLDMMPLRDVGIIYKENEVWTMELIGGKDVFRFRKLFSNRGIIGMHAVCDLGDAHFVVDTDDIYIHDGVRDTSILDGTMRDEILNFVQYANEMPVHVAYDAARREVWMGTRGGAGSGINRVYVWNRQSNTITRRGLSNTAYNWFNYGGIVNSAVDALDHQATRSFMVVGTENTLRIAESSFQLAGTTMTCQLERKGLTFGDESRLKHITRIWPRINTDGAGSVTVNIGYHNEPDGSIIWSGAKDFTPGTTQSLSFDVKGRYIAIRFKTSTGNSIDWTLDGFAVEARLAGKF